MANTGKVFATFLLETAAVYIIAFYIVFSLGAENNGSYLPNFLDSTPFRYHQMHTLELPLLSIFILSLAKRLQFAILSVLINKDK